MNGQDLQYDFEQSIGAWVVPAARALVQAMNEELAPLGVTHPQWTVLLHLVRDPSVSQALLAERLGIEPPTLCRILDRMERDGWIARRPCPEDRRRNRIQVEPRVEPVWRRIVECSQRVRARATQGIDPSELDTLRRALIQVRTNLENGTP